MTPGRGNLKLDAYGSCCCKQITDGPQDIFQCYDLPNDLQKHLTIDSGDIIWGRRGRMLCVNTVYYDRGTMGNADICMTYGVYPISWYEAAHAVDSIRARKASAAILVTRSSSINTVLIAHDNVLSRNREYPSQHWLETARYFLPSLMHAKRVSDARDFAGSSKDKQESFASGTQNSLHTLRLISWAVPAPQN